MNINAQIDTNIYFLTSYSKPKYDKINITGMISTLVNL